MLIQEDYFKNIFNTFSEAILTLDENMRVLSANRSFFTVFQVDSANTVGSLLYDLGNGQWNIPNLRVLLEDILPENNTVDAYEIEHIFKNIGRKTMLLNACKIREKKNDLPIILLTIEDITERRRKEEEHETMLRWKESVNLLQRSLLTLATQEQKIKSITDGIVRIFNADFCRIWLISPGDLCEQGCVHAEAEGGPHVCRYRDRCLHLLASSGRYTHTDGKVHRRVPFGCYKIGLIASGEEHKFLTNDLQNDPLVDKQWARDLGLVSFVGYQLRVPDGQTIGVMAFFAKHPISADEDSMLDGLCSTAALVIQQTAAETELKKSEKKYKDLFNTTLDGIYQIDAEGVFILMNPAGAKMFGYDSPDEIIGRKGLEYWRDPRDKVLFRSELMVKKSVSNYHMRLKKKNGEPIEIETSSSIKEDGKGAFLGMEGILRDVTDRKKLEAQLRHSQKMEAVGALAGGIAHDFNNILNVIMGYGSLVMDTLEAGSPSKEHLNEVLIAADKAATLTKRLLVFSRKQVVEVKPININQLILGLQKMLDRIISESIDFSLDLADRPLIVLADAGQIEQVLINLATNAKDAMQEGGRLTISTGLEEMDDEYVALYGYGTPGKYALITFADTGQGMDAGTQKKIFDPFFTTKGIGEGTGLGLAISYGIIKQHSGYINVYSKPGQGTVFKIYLPLSEEGASPDMEAEVAVPFKGGNETVLVTEDDASLRTLTRVILESFGYTVISAEDGEDAITIFMENRERISIVLIDMIMPKKNGKEVSEAMRKVSPGIKILFMSGYTMDMIKTNELTEAGGDFIHKPFLPADLLIKVREILDR